MGVSLERDEEMWQSIYQKHGSDILAYFRVRIPYHEDAEDLLQETFVKAIHAAHTISDLGKIRSFLFSIAHNLLLNRVRARKRLAETDAHPPENLAAREVNSPEHLHHMSSFRVRLSLFLNELPPKLRQAFELGVLQQEPYARIAEKTGWTLASVKINVYRARQQALEKLGDFLP